ncbi:hypothetical protein PHYBLDRAFT_62849 [Phycomyces blakesleeanus NRRL 1555(-)]|uniref:Uncharacterized protein n=1 Tax=Phycomyces blakesleeanus (strain ATCC 8743b / DSM 1359 / FGSC 10004 / NBRC 33097 / NRRL 1555) TaxID=763407 RepID=A0A167NZV5_PHYB8|nr:hypothetical protein PHYBLDRAFT_62849 [Phycomyces blakesleeanus NRRL 1555(-)]OAD76961.1 hypothetical protein PHYBLDRAFT_62849 [Phycomyces blakesleeanus NRRL 1555(-)]|eukprot:XP_018295001.1 hypothetical protein PHYBLDRAFT_62849 [Phycomyces blakesleeanus NRRL 1555(-)]
MHIWDWSPWTNGQHMRLGPHMMELESANFCKDIYMIIGRIMIHIQKKARNICRDLRGFFGLPGLRRFDLVFQDSFLTLDGAINWRSKRWLICVCNRSYLLMI